MVLLKGDEKKKKTEEFTPTRHKGDLSGSGALRLSVSTTKWRTTSTLPKDLARPSRVVSNRKGQPRGSRVDRTPGCHKGTKGLRVDWRVYPQNPFLPCVVGDHWSPAETLTRNFSHVARRGGGPKSNQKSTPSGPGRQVPPVSADVRPGRRRRRARHHVGHSNRDLNVRRTPSGTGPIRKSDPLLGPLLVSL